MDTGNSTLPGPSLESQIIFRLASLEATFEANMKNMNEKLETLAKEFHNKDVNRASQVAALDAKLNSTKESLEQRITKLEFFRTELLAKATAAAAVVGLLWVVFGEGLRRLLGIE